MKIPEKLKIGPLTYTVESNRAATKELNAQGRYGEHSEYTQRIAIDIDASKDHQGVTLFHEIMHALDCQGTASGSDGDSLTESQLKRHSHGLYQVLNDNGLLSEDDGGPTE